MVRICNPACPLWCNFVLQSGASLSRWNQYTVRPEEPVIRYVSNPSPPPPPRSTGMVDYRPLEGQDIIIHLFWVRMGQLWGEGGGWEGGLICPLENPTNKFLRSGHPPPATPPTSPHPNPSNLTLNYVPVSAINPSRGP